MSLNKNAQEKEEFLNRMLRDVNKIPVEDVVGSVVELHRKGQYLMGLCPFHADAHLGSFIVTPSKNLWRCFAEDIGGGPVSFVMEYDRLSYIQAAFKLAKDYNIITAEEYKAYGGKRYDSETVTRIRKKLEERKPAEPKASDSVIAKVYDAMAHVCPLSDSHKKHLMHERLLNDLSDFFTFPTRNMNLADRIIKYLTEEEAKEYYQKPLKELSEQERLSLREIIQKYVDELPRVPGFYKNLNNGRIDFVSYRGIGIVARDERGRALGIQIRRDTVKKGEQRYVWFSSAFAQDQSYLSGGSSSGSPGGYVEPRANGSNAICITEGRFKAEKIADCGNRAIYVSGVSAWKSVLPMILRLENNRKVFLMFDSDMMGNTAVHKQLCAFSDELKKNGISTHLILWSIRNGKGFDDLVINKGQRYAQYLKSIPYQTFEVAYAVTLKEVLQKFGCESVRDIRQEDIQRFTNTMQSQMETTVGIKTP